MLQLRARVCSHLSGYFIRHRHDDAGQRHHRLKPSTAIDHSDLESKRMITHSSSDRFRRIGAMRHQAAAVYTPATYTPSILGKDFSATPDRAMNLLLDKASKVSSSLRLLY